MLISDYKCIYIHIPKVAGQSIERYFFDTLGIEKHDSGALLLGKNTNLRKGPPRLAHLTAMNLLEYDYIKPKDFEEYYKFAFVRNPWSRVVSFYKFLGFQSLTSFEKFVKIYLAKKLWNGNSYWFLKPQHEFITDPSGKILVDFVGKFENLESDFNTVQEALGLASTKLPHLNRTNNSVRKYYHALRRNPGIIFHLAKRDFHKHYQDYYNEETIQIVSELYSDDIRMFNYKFS